MIPTKKTLITEYWQRKGRFNEELYKKYLMASSENKPEKFNEPQTEGKYFNVKITYILMFVLIALLLILLNITS
jgi:hypothetical protein